MSSCDMCGRDGAIAIAKIEGVDLTVCEKCARFGKVVRTIQAIEPKKKGSSYSPQPQRQAEEESMEVIVDDFASRIKQKREQLKLTQQEFAKMLSEKESLVHHLENGSSHPPIDLARKLERILKIQLVEVAKEAQTEKSKSKSDGLTLGDFIKIKR